MKYIHRYNRIAPCAMALSLTLLIIFGLTACSKNRVASNSPVTPMEQNYAVSMQRGDVMSLQDANRTSQIANSIDSTDAISDQDLDWAIALMRKPSKSPGLLHARAMGLFLDLMEVPPKKIPPSQRKKMLEAINPYLHDGNKLDEKYSAAVKRGIDRMNQHQP